MAIPEAQLKTWCNQGATVTSSDIYASIKSCLDATNSKIYLKNYEIYLQGSYKNDTNIYGDSDIDIVVQYHSTWNRDISRLSEPEKEKYLATYPNATYLWEHFYTDVYKTLCDYYTQSKVDNSGKVLKVDTGKSYKADVVVATDYRKYTNFQSDVMNSYIEGMKFQTLNGGREVINFPKEHYKNGVEKNSAPRTSGRYKPTVRMFKNIRNYLLEKSKIKDGSVPSYFLEGMLFNVPDSNFHNDVSQTFCDVVNYLDSADLEQFICQNRQLDLFGGLNEQWTTPSAKAFIAECIKIWNSWT